MWWIRWEAWGCIWLALIHVDVYLCMMRSDDASADRQVPEYMLWTYCTGQVLGPAVWIHAGIVYNSNRQRCHDWFCFPVFKVRVIMDQVLHFHLYWDEWTNERERERPMNFAEMNLRLPHAPVQHQQQGQVKELMGPFLNHQLWWDQGWLVADPVALSETVVAQPPSVPAVNPLLLCYNRTYPILPCTPSLLQ